MTQLSRTGLCRKFLTPSFALAAVLILKLNYFVFLESENIQAFLSLPYRRGLTPSSSAGSGQVGSIDECLKSHMLFKVTRHWWPRNRATDFVLLHVTYACVLVSYVFFIG